MSAIVPNGSSDLSGSGSRARFSRSSRLLRHADFERVYKQGQRHFAAHMTVFYLRRAQGDAARVGFTVGRVLGGAVDRNRMKRRLREACRTSMANAQNGFDAILVGRSRLPQATYDEIQTVVNELFRKARLLPEDLGQL